MGRTEEFSKRKQNKAVRKRLRADSGELNGQEAAAAKKRRKRGVRKIMEGMCYTLPTIDNPFNEPDLREASMAKEKQRFLKSSKGNPTTEPKKKKESPKTPENRPRRVFWPLGVPGKEPLESMNDARIPQASKTAFELIRKCTFEVGIFKLPISQFLERKENLNFILKTSEGCLRGKDVLAILGDQNLGEIREVLYFSLGIILPAVAHLKAQESAQIGKGPKVLILVKNSQTCVALRQILKVLKGEMEIRSLSIHEDSPFEKQEEGLKTQAVEILLATPERLVQVLDNRAIPNLGQVTFLAIFEASEMIKVWPSSTSNQISKILSQVHPICQRVILSANGGPPLRQLAIHSLKDPIFRSFSPGQSDAASCAAISIKIQPCGDKTHRIGKVIQFVRGVQEEEKQKRTKSRILVIVQSEEGMERIRKQVDFEKDNFKAVGFSQSQSKERRTQVANDFHSGKSAILVVPQSEIGANELKLSGVSILVLDGLLNSKEKYFQVVGAMARNSTRGQVFCVFSPEMALLVPQLVEFLENCKENVPPKLALMAQAVSKK